jgi:hypothetical protein
MSPMLKSEVSLNLGPKIYKNQPMFVQGNLNIIPSDHRPPELVTRQTTKHLNQLQHLRRNLPGAVLKLLILQCQKLLYQQRNHLMKYVFWWLVKLGHHCGYYMVSVILYVTHWNLSQNHFNTFHVGSVHEQLFHCVTLIWHFNIRTRLIFNRAVWTWDYTQQAYSTKAHIMVAL